jgi:hypothetical protein
MNCGNCVLYAVRCERLTMEHVYSLVQIRVGVGVEYLHRDPASCMGRRKGKSQIWESKIWSRVPRDSDPRKTALARRAACTRDRPVQWTTMRPEKSSSRPIGYPGAAAVAQVPCVVAGNSPFHSAVDISTVCWLGDRGVRVGVPVRSRIVSSPRRPDGLWGPPSLLSNGYRG